MKFEVRDNAGNVEEFTNRPDAQMYLARHGGVLKPV